ncbi:arsenical pump-driving ATPase [Halalkalibacter nanhaiisediminis]|uniref:Arsenite efflux ATP-binding protein ArsA (TC 3.A.4.1.1) n=1 Tax=Halalkalibacter nanhaiisediminis TaxID=688079 RepID=A0A562QTC8_9BACI|nr:arsenical pump-driving ATPase [Halalkalibacter nanhaiisediminis]TWI60048.1 arsenite efflux ATP-binding protein ArsA (TC 3.A.4.1.1) [Halalkalibacter nanhaiisediminis]
MMQRFNPKLVQTTPYLFFTGKGGVGKTSTACATAVTLADEGKKVLLVSTDPASNLQDVFDMEFRNQPLLVKKIDGLYACNLDPEQAAKSYRDKVIGPYRGKLPDTVVDQMEEQLSGACTVEIAAFDEFTNLLANKELINDFDHIIFDTAPTGHTLRLLQLPSAWTGFLEESSHGASCLGPLSGLGAKKELYAKTVEALSDPSQTKVILVARPDTATFYEAKRAANELKEIGIENQCLIINGVLQKGSNKDTISDAFYCRQQNALKELPSSLKQLETYTLPYVSYSLVGAESLRYLFKSKTLPIAFEETVELHDNELLNMKETIDDLYEQNTRVIFTMGKGGVGKTTIASLIAVGLVEKGQKVHLTTTDPAAHLELLFQDEQVEGQLTISRIDPTAEVAKYKEEVLSNARGELDEDALVYLEEDLNSPCTEEIAVFRAFAEVVERSKEEVVVIDTAPTGHTLLLLDAAQSYQKELTRSTGEVPESVRNLLPRLRNSEETSVLIVTLAEATPVYEATRLQEDLKRAGIDPKSWIINQSLYGTNTEDQILSVKAKSEKVWIKKVSEELAGHTTIIPWQPEETLGYKKMKELIL